MRCFAAAPSGSSATATSRSRRRPRTSSAYFRTAIKRRRRGRVVRLELEPDMPDSLVNVVKEGLDASNAITSETRGFLGMTDLSQLVEEDRPDLKFPPFNPRFPERIREHGGDCFAAIQREGHPRPPPLRELRGGGRVHPAGRRRSRTSSRSSRRSTAPASSRRSSAR